MITYNNLKIETTRRCTLRCKHCEKGPASGKDFQAKFLPKIFTKDTIIHNLELDGGDVLLAADILEMIVDYIIQSECIVLGVSITTNGTYFTPKSKRILSKLKTYVTKCQFHIGKYSKAISLILAADEYHKAELNRIKEEVIEVRKLKDIDKINNNFTESEYISKSYISEVDPATGEVTINLEAPAGLYSQVLKDTIGVTVGTKADLLSLFQELNVAKREYDQIKNALKMVKQTGYGIASPTLEDMKLDPPEIIKQGSRYGIKLKAKAASIHMIKVEVESTFEPIIGSELQSKELIDHLTKNDNNTDIWKSEIFGRSLDVIVQEGIQAKLSMMPDNVRFKLCQTLTKIINKGSSNMIAIVL